MNLFLVLFLYCTVACRESSAIKRRTFQIWGKANFMGIGVSITYWDSCVNLSSEWTSSKRVMSVNTHGHCVTLYSRSGCSDGEAKNILDGSPFTNNTEGIFTSNSYAISSFRMCDLDETTVCFTCPHLHGVGSPEERFWSKMLSAYSNSRFSQFAMESKNTNGSVSWNFIYDHTDPLPRRGDRYQDALEGHIWMMRGLQESSPTGPFTHANIEELSHLAREVVKVRAEHLQTLKINWLSQTYTVHLVLLRLWNILFASLVNVAEKWKHFDKPDSPNKDNEGDSNNLLNAVPSVISCKPLVSPDMILSCIHELKSVPCNRPALPGTIVVPKCRPPYRVLDPADSFLETECREDGEWAQPLFKCYADCGRIFNKHGNMQIGDPKRNLRENPWHAAIYKFKNNMNQYSFLGSGSIIGPRVILIASHMVSQQVSNQIELNVDNSTLLRVAVGKHNSSWEYESPDEQRFEVDAVVPAQTFSGLCRDFDEDIAVLHLKTSIVYSEIAIPICIDWKPKELLKTGATGKTTGWAYEDGVLGPLEEIKIIYIDKVLCRSRVQPPLSAYITEDKFCGGTISDNSSVRKGFSGGALTFQRDGLHFLKGIVSLKLLELHTLIIFTNVTTHIGWLRNLVNILPQREEIFSYSLPTQLRKSVWSPPEPL